MYLELGHEALTLMTYLVSEAAYQPGPEHQPGLVPHSIRKIAEDIRMPKSTVARMLNALCDLGFLSKSVGQKVGQKMGQEMGQSYLVDPSMFKARKRGDVGQKVGQISGQKVGQQYIEKKETKENTNSPFSSETNSEPSPKPSLVKADPVDSIEEFSSEEWGLVNLYVEGTKPTNRKKLLPLVRVLLEAGWTAPELTAKIKQYFRDQPETRFRLSGFNFFDLDVVGLPPAAKRLSVKAKGEGEGPQPDWKIYNITGGGK